MSDCSANLSPQARRIKETVAARTPRAGYYFALLCQFFAYFAVKTKTVTAKGAKLAAKCRKGKPPQYESLTPFSIARYILPTF
jgi:hypothetical protein